MDNVGFTLHVALYLAYLEEKHHGNTVDRLFLIKKIIFTSLADLVLSDINSGTKWYIQKLNPDIFSELYEKAFSHIYEFEGPDFFREDIVATIHDADHNFESEIFLAAKKYVGYVEASTNARVFPEMYEVPLRELQRSLYETGEKLSSLKTLLRDENAQKYLSHVNRLSFSMRWNQYRRTFPISVMSHKVVVAYLSYVIGMYEKENLGIENNIEEMLMRAIYHDVPEVITGDIITPTKKAVPGFEKLLETVETDMLEDYLFSYISPEYKAYITPYMLHPFDDDLGKKVKYADNLSALFEAKLEDISGNKSFESVTKKLLQGVKQIKNESVEYIVKDMFFYFNDVMDDRIS